MEVSATDQFAKFPPFYTIQKAETTRKYQLQLWRRLITSWVQQNNASTIVLAQFPLFENKEISRKLDEAGQKVVANDLIQHGYAKWVDEGHTTLTVSWKTTAQWAEQLYKLAQENGMVGTLYTLFELHSGDICRGTEFYGMDSTTLLQALETLQHNNQVQLYSSGDVDETGVKFL